MKNKLLTIAASTVLIIYASFKIIQIIPMSFYRIYYPFTPFGQKLISFYIGSIDSWGLLALGLCGLVLVYADLYKDKDLDFQNRIANIKKIAYTAFTIFSIGLIFRFIYLNYTSYQSLVMYYATDGNIIASQRYLVNTVFLSVLSILYILGRILFGIYLLTKKDKLIKPFLIIYFTGFAYTFIISTIVFINAIKFNSELLTDASNFASSGHPENRINSLTITFVLDILILVAGLIIVLYGIKKEKLTVTE